MKSQFVPLVASLLHPSSDSHETCNPQNGSSLSDARVELTGNTQGNKILPRKPAKISRVGTRKTTNETVLREEFPFDLFPGVLACSSQRARTTLGGLR